MNKILPSSYTEALLKLPQQIVKSKYCSLFNVEPNVRRVQFSAPSGCTHPNGQRQMDYITLGGLQMTLPFPNIIGNMVTAHTQIKIVLRHPNIRQNHIFILSSIGGNTRTNAMISVAEERSSPP